MSTLTIQNILRQIDELPLPEQRQLTEMLAVRNAIPLPLPTKQERDKRLPNRPVKDRTRELAWLKEHQHEYPGQWVALDGSCLIAASANEQEVWDAIKREGTLMPLVHRITDPDEPLPIGGI